MCTCACALGGGEDERERDILGRNVLTTCNIYSIFHTLCHFFLLQDGSPWGIPLAVAGYEIWNANLFYSSWISSILCGYLWIEVFTLHDRGGTTLVLLQHHPQDATASYEDVVDGDARVVTTSAKSSNTFTKRWLFLLCTALIFMSSSISTYTSPVCQGNVLKSSSYCKLALTGIIVGGVFQLLITLCVGLFYRLSHTSRRNGSNANCNNTEIMTILSIRKRNLFASAAAVMSLILQIINTAVLTSPTGGGPGSISGTLYFACWMGFVLSFELCLRYLDVYSTAPSEDSILNSRTMSEDDVTVYEDTDDTDDSGRGAGINGRDEEKANRHMGTHAPKQEDMDVDNSQFFFLAPQPVESRSPSPASSGRREPSVASSKERSDPEVFANLSQEALHFNDSSPSIDPEGVLGNSYFTTISMNSRKTNKPYDETRLPVTRKKEPDAINLAFQPKPHPINRAEKLDDVKGEVKIRRMPSSSSISTKHSNLSPLAEGTTEDASPDEPSPETIPGTGHSNRQVGNNGRMTPTQRYDNRQGQQQQKPVDRTRTTKSGAPSRSSRSRSREKVVQSSYPVSSVGGSRSRHSTTPSQQKTVPLAPALLGNQRYNRSGSGGQSKSPKTVSSRAMESSNSAPDGRSGSGRQSKSPSAASSRVVKNSYSTPDDSGSNPPPTISDDNSSEEDKSDDINKKIIGSTEYRGPPPPPPPFQSPRMNSPPMQSIRTSIDGQGETDTIVSEPTLDAGLEDSINTPSPRPTRPEHGMKNKNNNIGSQDHYQSSSSTNSYEKKDSDDTNLLTRVHSLSSDEILSSNEGQTGIKVVDDIVAAALAYAEMTHGVAAGSRGAAVRRGSGTTAASSQQLPPPIGALTPQSSQKKIPSKRSSKKHQEAKSISTSGESSSSVHSFYSKKRGGTQPSNPGLPCSTPAEELLVKALSQAHRGHGNIGEQNYLQQQHRSARGAASQSIKSGVSIESVYSEEDTQFSTRVDYDC